MFTWIHIYPDYHSLTIGIQYISTATIARTNLTDCVSISGALSILSIDRGNQLQSNLFKEYNYLLGAKHIKTTTYRNYVNDGAFPQAA